ncbi:MAG TPA: dUTP diphosphatase [Rhabdochlamydiaceae bacterium]|nr:dUTP diphosphatase [Rhabdochlamydiaceae bacterium]
MQKKEVLLTIKDPSFLPTYGSELASGADVRAYIEQDLILEPGATLLIPTGIHFAIPEGYEIQVRPRSGLALKHGITILNTPGTIDADYRGELGLILINHGKKSFTINRGMRLAQIVLAPVVQAEFLIVESLEATTRGEGGFGHTGTH